MSDLFDIPFKADIERSYLTCVVSGGLQQALDDGVQSDWFHDLKHRQVWDACCELRRQDAEIDQLSLLGACKGHALFLADLFDDYHGLGNQGYYFKDLKAFAYRRKAYLAHLEGLRVAQDESRDPQDVQNGLEKAFYELSSGMTLLKDQNVLKREFVVLLEQATPNGLPERGCKTGLPAVDHLLRGFQESSMNILAARPGRGKTSLALQIALEVAQRGDHVHLWSYEMPYNQLATKAITYMSGEDVAHYLETGYGNQNRILLATDRFFKLPLTIVDRTDTTIHDIRSAALRSAKENGSKLFVIDYLQLIPSGRRIDNRVQEIGLISRELKKTFMATGVPGLVLAQMNRSIEARESLPRLSDLRESGSLEQDSDTVSFLHDNPDDKSNDTTLLIRKNRHGATGQVSMVWTKWMGKFECVERAETTNQTNF